MTNIAHILLKDSVPYDFFTEGLVSSKNYEHQYLKIKNNKFSIPFDLEALSKSKPFDFIFLSEINSYKYLIPKLKKFSEIPMALFFQMKQSRKLTKQSLSRLFSE